MAELSAEKRGIVVWYYFHDRLRFTEIAARVPGVTADGARKLCRRARERAGSNNLDEILKATQNRPRSGRPVDIKPGSQESIRIRDAIWGQYKFQSQHDAANRVYKRMRHTTLQELPAAQVHNITHSNAHCEADPVNQEPITRKRGVEKAALVRLDLQHRKQLIEQILSFEDNKVVLIAVDETPIDFGGAPHRRVSAPRGVTVFVDSLDPRFTKMQWAAASTDTSLQRPWRCWNRETEEEGDKLIAKLGIAKQRLLERVEEQRRRARIEGTKEWHYLKHLNDGIEANNARLPRGQRKGRQQRYTIERAFKTEKLERDNQHGGLDFVWYAFEVYEKLLFPYVRDIKEANHGKRVYITEDNVKLHIKARRLLAPQIEEEGIEFLDWPVYSSDLHPIEHLHKDQKKELENFRFNTTSAAAAVQVEAESEMERVWCRSASFNEKVREKMSIGFYKLLAGRSKAATPAYSNRYKDSI